MEINDFALLGVIIIVLIICMALFIFAPKSINYYPGAYPDIKYIHKNNKELIKKDIWLKWPDKEHISGNVCIYPLYMFSILLNNRKDKCYNTYNQIKKLYGVKSCAFIKFDKQSKIIKNQQWKDLSNNTLRVLFILEAGFSLSDEKLGIWINGEIKKIKNNSLIIFDSSKEHSIYNNTNMPVYALLIDIQRPKNISKGISTREYTDEVREFVTTISIDS
jgi:hypothetical protein